MILQRRLEISDKQHPDLQSLRRHISSCFREIECFLMPHPGMVVATSPNFDGDLSQVDVEFLSMAQEFVSAILDRDTIAPKSINGHKIQAKNLFQYIKTYWEMFNGDSIPQASTLLGATTEAIMLSEKDNALEVYNKKMGEYSAPDKNYYDFGEMMLKNNEIKCDVINLVSISFYLSLKISGKY